MILLHILVFSLLQLYQKRRPERKRSERRDASPLGPLDGGEPVHDAFPEGRRGTGYGAAAAAEAVPVRPHYGADEGNGDLTECPMTDILQVTEESVRRCNK